MQMTKTKSRAIGLRKLHLGCGHRHLDGWVNVDLDAPGADIFHDLTRPLPFADACASHIYCEHFIEHIDRDQGRAFLKECHRVLAPGGTLRLSTPDLRFLVAQYLEGRTGEWADMGWAPRDPCDMLNEGMRLWGHRFVYDAETLAEALFTAGFSALQRQAWGVSEAHELAARETRPWHHELIFEAVKPA